MIQPVHECHISLGIAWKHKWWMSIHHLYSGEGTRMLCDMRYHELINSQETSTSGFAFRILHVFIIGLLMPIVCIYLVSLGTGLRKTIMVFHACTTTWSCFEMHDHMQSDMNRCVYTSQSSSKEWLGGCTCVKDWDGLLHERPYLIPYLGCY